MKTYTEEQKKTFLTEAFSKPRNVEKTRRKLGLAKTTVYRWQKQYPELCNFSKPATELKEQKNCQEPSEITIEVKIPEHVIQAAAAQYLEKRLGFKLLTK